MTDINHSIIASKASSFRQRSSLFDFPSGSLTKLERGLVQRSLLYCFEKGYFSLIRYLLQSGASDARERDHEGRTGLMYCCFVENDIWAHNIAITLLEHGAKIEDQDRRGLNALHYAIITHRLNLVRRYLSSLDFDLHRTIDIHGNTFLHYACSSGNTDIVRLILTAMNRYAIDVNIQNHAGLTAYDIARQFNRVECENLLRNEFLIRQKQQLPVIKSHDTPKINESFTDRRSSISTVVRSITSSTHQSRSIVSPPLCISSAKSFRPNYGNVVSISNENRAQSPVKLIDPIESRRINLKRNENLDSSLVNLVKRRTDFAPINLTNPSTIFNSSSSTWRDDFCKMFGQLQAYKTSSIRKTVHPPLSNQLSCEAFDRLYGTGPNDPHDCSNHQPLSSLPINSPKITTTRRGSTSSIKSLPKTKK